MPLRRGRMLVSEAEGRTRASAQEAQILGLVDLWPASHRPRKINTSPGLAPSILPASDVVRALLRFRYDREFRGQRRVPIRTLATFVGLSHETLYQAMRVGTASECTRAKLTWALRDIAEGRLRFRRRGQRWEPEGHSLFSASA
jgi:hypothetical protein